MNLPFIGCCDFLCRFSMSSSLITLESGKSTGGAKGFLDVGMNQGREVR